MDIVVRDKGGPNQIKREGSGNILPYGWQLKHDPHEELSIPRLNIKLLFKCLHLNAIPTFGRDGRKIKSSDWILCLQVPYEFKLFRLNNRNEQT